MANITIADVRAKYPQYSDMSDVQLADALHAKYYPDMDKAQFYAKIGLKQSEAAAQSAEQEQGFFGNVADAAVKRAGSIDSWKAPVVLGQVAGFANDVAGEVLKSLYTNLVPKDVQERISNTLAAVMETKGGQAVAGAIEKAGGAYQEFKGKNPELAKDLEGYANIAGLIPVGKAANVSRKVATEATKDYVAEAANIAKDVKNLVFPPAAEALDRQLKNIVKNGVDKGLRPTVVGKETAGQVAKYYDRATEAVKNIVENKANLNIVTASGEQIPGKLPTSLNELSQAISQTKQAIYNKYDAMARAAGQGGVSVDLSNVVKELETIATNKVIMTEAPEVATYAAAKAEAYRQAGAYSVEEAQEAVKIANSRLEAFYKKPEYNNAAKVQIDALVANNIRKELDDAIEAAVGDGYQELKNAYGALRTIEKEVNHRMIVDARKAPKGLLDHYSVFTGYEAVRGILEMKPTVFASATAARLIQEGLKFRNNPNNIIASMFKAADRTISQQQALQAGLPKQSVTFQQLFP